MQIMIDTNADSPHNLVMLASFLSKLAAVDAGPGYEKVSVDDQRAQVARDETYIAPDAEGRGRGTPRDAPLPPPLPPMAVIPPVPAAPPELAADDDEDDEPALPPVPPPPSVAPQQLPLPPGGGLEYDSVGLPWDARIHLTTKAKTIRGEWKLRRRLDEATLAAVRAQLEPYRSTVAPPPPPPMVAPVPVSPVTLPPTAPAPSSVSPGPPPGALDFRNLMLKITEGTKSGRINQGHIDSALVSVGLPPKQMTALALRPELIPAIGDYIDRLMA